MPLGVSLGEWVSQNPDERLVFGSPSASVPISGPNSNQPFEGIWCARSTRTLREGPGWKLRRQAYFVLLPPDSLPTIGAAPEEIRRRFCRLVMLAGEVIGDSASQVEESSGYTALERWNADSAIEVNHRHGYHGLVGSDGTGRGAEESVAELKDDASCVDGDGREDGADLSEGPTCKAFWRLDTTRTAWGVSRSTQSSTWTTTPGDLGWLATQASFLSADDRETIQELRDSLSRPDGRVREPDERLFNRLLTLRANMTARSGREAPLALTILDVAINSALRIGELGAGGESNWIDSLGASMHYWELGADWEDRHRWMDSARVLGPEGELADSIFVWSVATASGCAPENKANPGWVITRAREFTAPSHAQRTRGRAWLTMAQQWTDSLVLTQDDKQRAAIRDSVAVALRNALAFRGPDPEFIAAHHALWRWAGGLRPLYPGWLCDEGD